MKQYFFAIKGQGFKKDDNIEGLSQLVSFFTKMTTNSKTLSDRDLLRACTDIAKYYHLENVTITEWSSISKKKYDSNLFLIK